jgi:ankyrin repeat protein
MQLRRKRGIRKLHVCESEDDDNELAPENQPNINSSKRVLNLLESDDGAQVNTPRRDPSSRSSKLQELKSTQRERLLQKLHQGKDESETDSESTSDDDQRVDPNAGVVLSGEQILFPESDSEEMDWIVSDSENSTHDYDVQEADCTTDVPVDDWKLAFSSMHMFRSDVKFVLEDVHKFKERLLNSMPTDNDDDDGFYPLIYSAALADEDALRELLPGSKMEPVQNVLTTHHTSLLKIIVEAPLRKVQNKSGTAVDDNIASLKCLQTLAALRREIFKEALKHEPKGSPTTLSFAVWNRKPQCASYLIQHGAEVAMHSVRYPPTLLHLAVMANDNDESHSNGRRESCVALLLILLPLLSDEIEFQDDSGFTPLMKSCVAGDVGCLQLLLDFGASIDCRDAQKTSPLHLAAASGWIECVNELIMNGHPVDCVDKKGWSPLLYAHFQNHQDCVLALMEAKTEQLSIVGNLLQTNRDAEEGWGQTVKVVRSLLVSLAHHEAYHALFNKFVRQNPLVFEEKEYGFLKHCMGLLDFDNKLMWIRGKLKILTKYAEDAAVEALSLLSIPRSPPEGLLALVQDMLYDFLPSSYWAGSLIVTFANEAGICTGPRKEFWSLYCQELVNGKDSLFSSSDNGQAMLQPGVILMQSTQFAERLALVHHVGMILAQAVFHGDNIPLHLVQPLLKQLLGIQLSHPEDLEQFDEVLHHNLTSIDDISVLDLTFEENVQSPRNLEMFTFPLLEGGCNMSVTTENKDEYIRLMSEFKLEKSVAEETKAFCAGFWKVIPKKCLQVLTTNELSLFVSGIPTIDVDDWEKQTVYAPGVPENTKVWFWKLVHSLREEEKALLLKFSTGSPCVPVGGFKNLQGLGGLCKFQIKQVKGTDKVSHSSTIL